MVSTDEDGFTDPWNAEGEDLAFLRDEGLELLALFKRIHDREKRDLVMRLLRALAAEPDPKEDR